MIDTGKLSCTHWTEHSTTPQSITTGTTCDAPAPTGSASSPQRFVEVHALDGDLLIRTGTTAACADPDTGCRRILAGQQRIFQLPTGGTPRIKLKAVSGTVNAIVAWGR